MKTSLLITCLLLGLTACAPETPATVKQQQSSQAEAAANSLTFTGNAEIENIKKRLELTSKPGALGYIVLLNQSGQPVAYHAVKGKVTSSGKRLTRTDERWSTSSSIGYRPAASDEGTFGSSDPYIYFWDVSGRYVQWSGQYLYSDQPIRLRVEPLVISAPVVKK
ncbi:hypothetical protein [Deinococcus sp. QL22]|uniref:hypothetical protein n=1 Tax=Deinococcus sp. QL22 TaxID=2939437 RepID=UPI0020175B4C|nr:hypothetical protein [Deinococcus sp. QL22]UQN10414.1 hypothetical protein M1R55_30130 [Deinococcus sp. QL22]UQN10548.1 hypothetical protein M1R55_29455 [Deinococcus sp. QL22]